VVLDDDDRVAFIDEALEDVDEGIFGKQGLAGRNLRYQPTFLGIKKYGENRVVNAGI
jgi:hypothetical protein